MHFFKSFLTGFITILFVSACHADPDLISLFPLDHYDQTISTWIKPTDSNYDQPLLDASLQKKRLDDFYAHYFGSSSPWNAEYINQILHVGAPNNIKSIEQTILANFNNQDKPADQLGYGENFHPYGENWIKSISDNINLAALDNLTYQPSNRGIAIDNSHARVLPTDDVHFYSYKLAGQGYPFDNLQMSSLWAGTPVYILTATQDHAWFLVATPDYIGWVKSSSIARATTQFIETWASAAKKQLAAMTHTQTSMLDDKGIFRFSAYVGSVFPAEKTQTGITASIPISNSEGYAERRYTTLLPNQAVLMPAAATPHNFATIMSTLINRPYGWGNMYFYNDCSAELKSLFTPFGIWIPRHSSNQVNAGRMVDMTSFPPEQRLSYLMENGHKFFTIIYIGGHVVMYLGNYPNPNESDHKLMAMTYQNLWGLSPSPAIRRAVIGESVLFPMLLRYPEDTSLMSLASKKYFQVAYLDEMPNSKLMQLEAIDLKALMYPEN
ncbi:MAG: hypothetical protein ACD_45C00620G0007 [uncultured bacterium]|nr:MAG: hypothetical protein ACD_45C00620G0007 [uncultured bacterium]